MKRDRLHLDQLATALRSTSNGTCTRLQRSSELGQSSSAVKITPQDRSILDLKLQRDKLKQYQRKIEVVLKREREIAAESLRAGNKQRALIALRQKKYQESLLSQTDSQLETLQKLVQSIEFSLVEKDVLFGLQQGSEVLKQLNQELDINKVEKLMDETREGIAYQEEVSALLSSRISAQDEEDVLAELAALQEAEVGDKLPQVPVNQLPLPERTDEPTKVLPDAREEEERQPQRQRQAIAA
ncbi:Snf7 family protein [Sporobolomyces koalae]|uniref:Snf7 family protein n=1 Tax=Sporobolomyces koalae TaxID=500713 RepID=UPI00316FF104